MYILFDIGGTNMRVACSIDGKKLTASTVRPTPKNFELAMKQFKEIVIELSKGKKIVAGGGGIAGTFDKKKEVLVNAPNLTNWVGKPIKKTIKQILKAPVFLENDTAVIALGEAVYGAGKGYKIVSYLTVSTGVGGARIINKEFDKTVYGFEPGHQIIDAGKSLCDRCNGAYDLEDYISGTGLASRYNMKAQDIKDPKIWDEIAYFLAIGLHNTILHWSPEIVILGGAMMRDIKIVEVKKHLKKILKIYPNIPVIKEMALGNNSGFYGALYMIKKIYKK